MRTSDRFTLRVIEDDEAFLAMREEWNDLVGRDSQTTLFQLWEWNYTVWKYTGSPGMLRLVVAYRNSDDRCAGILPLCLNTERFGFFTINTVMFIGKRYLDHEYAIIDDRHKPDLLPLMLEWLVHTPFRWDLLDLKPVRGQVADVTALQMLAEKLGLGLRTEKVTVSPYLRLRPGAGVLGQLENESFVRYLKRKNKKINKDFQCALSLVETEAQLAEQFPVFVRMNRSRSRDKLLKGIFKNARIEAMLFEICRLMLEKGHLRFFMFTLDGTPAAGLLNFCLNETMWFYQSGLEPRFDRYSTGHVIHLLAIEKAIEADCQEYDFLNGDEPYKRNWTEHAYPLQRFLIIRSRWKYRCRRFAAETQAVLFHNRLVKRLYFIMKKV